MFYYEFNKETNKHALLLIKKNPVERLKDIVSPPEFSTVEEMIDWINKHGNNT